METTAVHQELALHEAVLRETAQGVLVVDRSRRVQLYNKRFLEFHGLTAGDIPLGCSMLQVIEAAHAAGCFMAGWSVADLWREWQRRFESRTPTVVHRRTASDGALVIRQVPLPEGGAITFYEDVTELHRAEQDVRRHLELFDRALSYVAHGLCLYSADERLIACNDVYLDLYGLVGRDVKPGISYREVVRHIVESNKEEVDPEEAYQRRIAAVRFNDMVPVMLEMPSGRVIEAICRTVPDGGWVGVHQDVTERHRNELRIAHMARHDTLTDLPNRDYFQSRVSEALAGAEPGQSTALMFLDLDNFKRVNDALGHQVGDRLLVTISRRFRERLGRREVLARLGGDEFAVLMPQASARDAEMLARSLIASVDGPISIDGHVINTGVSVGVAVSSARDTYERLMRCADLALYQAKADGRGTYRFFEAAMEEHTLSRRALELDLRRALLLGGFHLEYQPQFELSTGAPVGMEALLRWDHPTRGRISPAEFIPAAEETGLIVGIGEWVLRRACADAAAWEVPLRLAVNLSPAQFRDAALVQTVESILKVTGLAPQRLELEITEALPLSANDTTVGMLMRLKELGVRIALDDFGAGYSSLSYLRSFPFDKIKIDRSFVSGEEFTGDRRAMLTAIVGLGSALGIDATAEGVETAEQLRLVKQAGCREVQGYLTGAPVPAALARELATVGRRAASARA